MSNGIALIMLSAIVGVCIFYMSKSRKAPRLSEDNNNGNKSNIAGWSMFLGMFVGFLNGLLFSKAITHVLFTERFIKEYRNPDIGEFSFYIFITFILTVLFGIIGGCLGGKVKSRRNNNSVGLD